MPNFLKPVPTSSTKHSKTPSSKHCRILRMALVHFGLNNHTCFVEKGFKLIEFLVGVKRKRNSFIMVVLSPTINKTLHYSTIFMMLGNPFWNSRIVDGPLGA